MVTLLEGQMSSYVNIFLKQPLLIFCSAAMEKCRYALNQRLGSLFSQICSIFYWNLCTLNAIANKLFLHILLNHTAYSFITTGCNIQRIDVGRKIEKFVQPCVQITFDSCFIRIMSFTRGSLAFFFVKGNVGKKRQPQIHH